MKDKSDSDELSATEKLEYCKLCSKSKFDMKQGIVCSLSDAKPTFVNSCPDFSLSESAQQKINVDKKRIAGEGYGVDKEEDGRSSRWISSIFGIVAYVLSRYLIFDGNHTFLTGVGSFVVGAVIGLVLMNLVNRKPDKS